MYKKLSNLLNSVAALANKLKNYKKISNYRVHLKILIINYKVLKIIQTLREISKNNKKFEKKYENREFLIR